MKSRTEFTNEELAQQAEEMAAKCHDENDNEGAALLLSLANRLRGF
jgi:hypothetical protein